MKAEVFLPDDYRPADGEPFMNDLQLEYFRRTDSATKRPRNGRLFPDTHGLPD